MTIISTSTHDRGGNAILFFVDTFNDLCSLYPLKELYYFDKSWILVSIFDKWCYLFQSVLVLLSFLSERTFIQW